METTNANESYRAARERLDEKLNRINSLVREHDAAQSRDRASWGHAGDINHVVELLNDVIEFLGGTKETAQ